MEWYTPTLVSKATSVATSKKIPIQELAVIFKCYVELASFGCEILKSADLSACDRGFVKVG